LIALLKKVNQYTNNEYLSEGQAMRIVADLEPKLINALNEKLKNLKTNFFKSSSDPSTASNLAYQLLRNGYGDATPGLKEYFAMNTATSNALKSSVYYMQTLNDVYEMIKINAGGAPGSVNVSMNEAEAMCFADVYFSKPVRDAAGSTPDKLLEFLAKMQKVSSEHSADKYNIDVAAKDDTDVTFKGDQYLNNMNTILAEIRASAMSPEEKYAALIVAKTRCIAMYKSYLMKTINNLGSSDVFRGKTEAEAMALLQERVFDRGWKTIFTNIEQEYNDLHLPNDYTFNKYSGAMSSKVTKDTAYGYATSPQM
jgi:hypothetical protein